MPDALPARFSSPPSPEPTIGAPPTPPNLIDDATLTALGQLMPEELRELLVVYFDHAESQLPILAEAAQRRALATVSEVAHSIKGASLSIGAARAATIAAEIEADATAGALTHATAQVAALERAVADTKSALRNDLRRR
jgi:HPt (histidine-containing phosphotransfer) domain-containing protein